MNKILIIPFVLLFFFNTNSQNSRGVIEYGKKSKKRVLTEKDKQRMKETPEKYKRFQKMYELYAEGEKKLTFELRVDNNIGIFTMKPLLESESNHKKQLGPGPYDKGVYYNKDKRILQLNAFGELFLITKPKLKWEIQKETKKIGEFECFKATTEIIVNTKGRKHLITAWFTTKIPISFGPLGYDGLPGLILELEVYKKIYYAKKIMLNPKEEIKIEKPTKGIKVTEKEYQEKASSTLQKNKGI
ncbi:GLPGLI family protein [Polaribacter sp. 11A2H]|uniref:GLPGLI family protein n=1 Tax=Polaribacter sp. 11A2H TaxID=2687290 RepID=UPI0014081D2A|nr:GLPGLI family protein [Polaribacter sp. 11A2H]